MKDRIVIKGARQHNLRDISAELPRDALIVFTGVSGSGKSSLAFDTIFAEGQRRYVESLSAYARQFLGQLDKPDVDVVEGLSPAIAIDQKTTGRNPRSTVGTITEVYDHLRLLYARVGRPHCPVCAEPVSRQTPQRIVDRLLERHEGARVQLLAPVVRDRKGEHAEVFRQLMSDGFSRVRVDGVTLPLSGGTPALDKRVKHSVEVVVDRLTLKPGARQRLTESVETALGLAGGVVWADFVALTIDEGLAFFDGHRIISRHLSVLHDVGLGYVKLGQAATTLSGGEAQRVKLAAELQRRTRGRTLYVLDEPTTGLHIDDVRRLLAVLHRFVDAGNTAVVIEHNLDVVKTADWVIDMGPEGGRGGGRVIAQGTPEHVAAEARSHTGTFLRALLERK